MSPTWGAGGGQHGFWLGKLAGLVLGFMRGGLSGALIGALIGHLLDRYLNARFRRGVDYAGPDASSAAVQTVFFETTFLVMGHLAKVDGRVSEEEIQAARSIMHHMRLRPEDVKRAIELFTAGKQAGASIDEQITRLRQACWRHPDLIQTFLEIQFELALSEAVFRRPNGTCSGGWRTGSASAVSNSVSSRPFCAHGAASVSASRRGRHTTRSNRPTRRSASNLSRRTPRSRKPTGGS